MRRCLLKVEDRFLIAGRGVIVVPGITPSDEERFQVGDPILLCRPDGTTLDWQIGGIRILHRPVPQPDFPILLTGLTKDDIPIGTEIWSVDAAK
jgi:hypothetical protein